MESFRIKINFNQLNYDYLIVNYSIIFRIDNNIVDNQVEDNFASGDYKKCNRRIILRIDGILAHYMIKELEISKNYRFIFINKLQSLEVSQVIIKLHPPKKNIIDYSNNKIINKLVWERLELDHALSWLSTLGGAFSALGDYFPNAAEMAGRISRHQFKLALKMKDPNIQARCRLFLSLSLIQQGYYKIAKRIILFEYKEAKNSIAVDGRLVKMCLGIWAKLKYEWNRNKMANIHGEYKAKIKF